jgi:hypothetical protein
MNVNNQRKTSAVRRTVEIDYIVFVTDYSTRGYELHVGHTDETKYGLPPCRE